MNRLFKAYFIENRKTLFLLCLITLGLTVFLFTLPSVPDDVKGAPTYLWFWLAGTFFLPYLKKGSSSHFFSLPATTVEKFIHAVAALLVAGIIIELLNLIGAVIGTYLIHPLFYSDTSHVMCIFELSSSRVFEYLLNIAIAMAFLFGSIYFKKNAFIKSLAIGIGVLFAVAIYFRAMEYFAYGKLLDDSVPVAELFFSHSYYYFIPIIFTLFFLVLTYLRLRETEV
jgi:hypothetical protein